MLADLTTKLTAPNGKTYIQPLGLFINNAWVKSSDGGRISSINPSNEQEIASVHAATTEDVESAVKAARTSLRAPAWRNISGTARGKLLARLSDLVEQNNEILATIESWDNGKAYSASLEDVTEVSETLRYYAGFADKVFGQVIETTPNKFAYTLREPVGVCAQIIPWNFPLAMAAWKLGPALACGNTVVLKPAEQTPLSILFLATLIIEAGFPPGVVNILNGLGRITGAALASHPDVDKIAFTGSTSTGREIMKLASSNLKNITLETGGKSPLIVFDDADLNLAVEWAFLGIMSNQGQICTATSRLLLHETIHDKFLQAFVARVKRTKIGDPFEEATFQGPQVSRTQLDLIKSYIDIGISEGAKLEFGGETLGGKGFFIQPTVFSGVTSDMKVFQEEVFGPFVSISRFKTEEEALNLANGTKYGLGSAIFTTDLTKAHRVAKGVEAGMVWINSSNDADWRVPFGGVTQSGVGRELGEAGLDAYSVVKAVHVNMTAKL